MKVVLDTSVLVSGVFWKGIPGQILDLLVQGKFDLVVTPSILVEYHRVLEEIAGQHDAGLVVKWSRFIAESAEIVTPSPAEVQCRDSHDQQFLECAVGGNADLLITGDDDLLSLVSVGNTEIVKPRVGLARL